MFFVIFAAHDIAPLPTIDREPHSPVTKKSSFRAKDQGFSGETFA
jgi:hypothetical protein